eukprot:1589094-Amphidinium_carterae.1
MQHSPRVRDAHGESDPDDHLPLTELLQHPGTPPHLFAELADEVAPTLLERAPDTLLVSDSDNATLDYNHGQLAQQGRLITQTSMMPTRSINDDPISQFSDDEELHSTSLLQRTSSLRISKDMPSLCFSWR